MNGPAVDERRSGAGDDQDGGRVKVPGKDTTISGETYQSLRAGILSGEIAPGSKVRTQNLSERFDVSLGAVREALSQLMAEGLVTAEAHRGYTVVPLSVEDHKYVSIVDWLRLMDGTVKNF